MWNFLTKLMLSKKLEFDKGRIIFSDQYMTFLPLSTLKEMTKDAEKKGKKGILELYFYGWHFGYEFTKNFMKDIKSKKFEETYKLIMDVASLIGYGDYKTLEFKQRKFSKFRNIKNPLGLLFYPSKEVHCHFIRGVNAGGGTALHEKLMNGIELECTANNKEHCLFINATNRFIRENYEKYLKKQLNVKWLEKKQRKLISKYNNVDKYIN